MLNLVEETVNHLKQFGFRRAGIMATDGTIRSALFQQELERQGMEAVLPSPAGQEKVMHLIYQNVKAGKPLEMDPVSYTHLYGDTVEGIFQARPNRFLARVEVEGQEELCHVKNTGRCRELSLIHI